jgi:hypothetical protein
LGGWEGVLVGAGVVWMWGGDACVAQGEGGRRARDQDEGDAHHKASPLLPFTQVGFLRQTVKLVGAGAVLSGGGYLR